MRSLFGTILWASIAIVAFGGNSLLARAALGDGMIGAGAFSAIRLAAGALILLPVIGRRPALSDWPGAVSLAVYVAGFSLAYLSLRAGTGALILFAFVQATIVVAGYMRGEALSLLGWMGLALAMTGLTVLLAPGGEVVATGAATMMAIAGIAWGAYTLIGREGGDATGRTARSFLLATPLMLPMVWFDTGGFAQPLMPTLTGMLLATVSGAVTSGLGYIAWYKVTPRLGLGTVASVQLATPVVAALGGVVMLSEPLSWRLLAGGALILGGIVLTLARPRAKAG